MNDFPEFERIPFVPIRKRQQFKWPTNKPTLAKRDKNWGTFEDFKKKYKGL